jgi:conserved oligomeric Golgi complex subunit 3
VAETRASRNPSTKQTEIVSPTSTSTSTPALQKWVSEVDGLNLRFREACERDLRSDVNRLHLYLEDQRTVHVLLDHIQERVMEAYAGYRDLVMIMRGPSQSGQDLLSATSLRELLREVCGENKV